MVFHFFYILFYVQSHVIRSFKNIFWLSRDLFWERWERERERERERLEIFNYFHFQHIVLQSHRIQKYQIEREKERERFFLEPYKNVHFDSKRDFFVCVCVREENFQNQNIVLQSHREREREKERLESFITKNHHHYWQREIFTHINAVRKGIVHTTTTRKGKSWWCDTMVTHGSTGWWFQHFGKSFGGVGEISGGGWLPWETSLWNVSSEYEFLVRTHSICSIHYQSSPTVHTSTLPNVCHVLALWSV